jgi:L-amino acid N-acyltransferase YncA
MHARHAVPADAPAIARIYNQGIEERLATFETRPRTVSEVVGWFDGAHPIVVVTEPGEGDARSERVIAFARSCEYSPRECYLGVFEFAVYTAAEARRKGAGTLAIRELVAHARAAGAWKLVSRVFVDNQGSRALLAAVGFREVGVYYRHGKLDGRWKDVVVVEKFLAPIGAETATAPARARTREEVLGGLRSDRAEDRALALGWLRFVVERDGALDPDVLEAAMDAFFLAKTHDAASRGQFVELFRAWGPGRAAGSERGDAGAPAAHPGLGHLIDRLDQIPIALDLDAFYEGAFVVKQLVFGGSDTASSAKPDLAPHVPRLLEWLAHTIELPPAMRTRISPGNVTALLMTLALAGCATEEERRQITELASRARERHRVEPPVSLRTSVAPPAAPSSPPQGITEPSGSPMLAGPGTPGLAAPTPPTLDVPDVNAAPPSKPKKKRAASKRASKKTRK